jgi:membrane protein YdbS with pleckstrin-like domain
MKSLADQLYESVSRTLKVPAGPLEPNGETLIRDFQPAARYAGYRLCRWVFTQLGIFIPFALILVPKELHGILEQFGFGWIQNLDYNARWQEQIPDPLELPVKILSLGAYVIQFTFSFVFTFLSAKSQSYLLTNHSLRIRRGLWVHQQITLSLINIQQVKYSQNLLERLWGIGSLEVRTAGGGAPAKKNKKNEDKSHTGELEGLIDPIALRELLNTAIKNASSISSSGRSFIDTTQLITHKETPEWNQAIHDLLLASRSLREGIAARAGDKV